MTTNLIAEKDRLTAEKFFANSGPLKPLFAKFPESIEPEISDNWIKLGCYLTYRLAGMEHSLAAMQACRRGPRMKNSDRTFNEGARARMNREPEKHLKIMLQRAQQAGIATQGKFYVAGLARRGLGCRDPRAWVSTTDDILTVAKRHNLEVEGVVNHKSVGPGPVKRVPMAEDIVQRYVQDEIQKDPALRERVRKKGSKALAALRERVIAKHARSTS